MSVDILEGDLLTVAGVDYPVRSVAEWSFPMRQSGSMRRMMTVLGSTKRSPGMVGGKRGDPVEKLTGLYFTPLDPADPDIKQRLALDTPHELLQTYVTDGSVTLVLILEDLKR